MKASLLIALILIFAAAAEEEIIPRLIYAQKAFCSGDNLRLSCADDGVPFNEYLISVVGINIFSSQKTEKACKPSGQFAMDDALCPIDYLLEASEYSGLGLEIETLCDGKRECFIKLPTPKDLSSNSVCGGSSYFYAVVVEFTCKEPSLDDTVVYKVEGSPDPTRAPLPFDYDYDSEDNLDRHPTRRTPEIGTRRTPEIGTRRSPEVNTKLDLHMFGYGESSASTMSLSFAVFLAIAVVFWL